MKNRIIALISVVALIVMTLPAGIPVAMGAGGNQTATNETANNETATNETIESPLVADFDFDIPECPLCEGITFTDQSTGGRGRYKYDWDFGDGGSSRKKKPTHHYAGYGNYTVTLTVTDRAGDVDSTSKTVTVGAATEVESVELDSGVSLTAVNSSWPRCISGCTAKDASITHIWLEADPSCTPGTPTSAELWATFRVTRRKGVCCVVSVVDIYVDGNFVDDYVTRIGDLPSAGTYDVKITDITWPCGSVMTLKDIYAQWIPRTGGGPCPTCNGSCTDYDIPSKCYYDPGPYEVPAPLIADFDYDGVCFCKDTSFTNNTTGGVEPYSYVWDFGGGYTSNAGDPTLLPNPIIHYDESGTYTVTLNVTDYEGTPDSQSYDVTIYPSPTASATSNSPVCEGATLTLTGGPDGMDTYAWTGPNSFTSSEQSPTVSTDATTAMAGEYTLTVTNSNDCSDEASTTVTVNEKPEASADNNGPVCEGATLTLTGGPDGMDTYAWTGPNSFTSSEQSPTVSTDATTAMAGEYTLTVTNSNDCSDEASTTVTVNEKPEASADNNGPVCEGATLTLTGGPDGMDTYAWTGPNSFTSSEQSPTVSTDATTAMAGEYTLTVTNSNDCSDEASTTVTVNEKPEASADNNGPVCEGATLTLTGGPDGMDTYAWTGPNSFTSSEQSPTVSTDATTAMAGEYTLTVTNSNDCSDEASTTVTVNEKPEASADNNGPVCEGATLTLTGGPDGMDTYAWTGPNSFTSSEQSPTVSTDATTAMAGEYTLTVTNSNDCSDEASTTVTVNEKPEASADNNGPVCEGATLTLTGGPDGMDTYAWTGPNSFTSSEQSPTVSTDATTAMAGEYTLTVTNSNDCSDEASTTVTVNEKPEASADNNGPVCEGATLTLTGGPDGMDTYAWTGPNSFTSSEQSPTVSTDATTAMAGEYTLTVTNSNDCSDEASTTVTVNEKPEASADNNGPVCEGATLTLTGGPDGMDTYAWTGPNSFTSSEQSPTVSTDATTAMAGEYTLTVTNSNDCSDEASTTVTVNEKPEASADNNGPVCEGATLTLTGGPDGMDTYAWTGPNSFTSSEQSPTVSTDATTAMAGEYTLTVTNSNDCSDEASTTVVVNEKPRATASSNTPVSQGDTIYLYGGPSGMTYSWTGPNSFSSDSQNPTIPDATEAMEGTYTLTVTSDNGCTDDATTDVLVIVPEPPRPRGGGGCPTTKYLTVDWEGNNTTEPLYSNDKLAVDLLGPSSDLSHNLFLEQGTHAPVVYKTTHYLIIVRELEEIPALPEDTTAIVVFNITPADAEFNRDIFLTLGIDELPENALNVTMAYYDDVNGVWVVLESEAGGPNGVAELTLSAPINHFSIFGVLAAIEPTPPPQPAHFVASGLSIEPSVERIWEPVTFVTKTGESVTITANVANDGGQGDTYTVELKLNGETADTKTVTLGAGRSKQVSFTVSGLDYGQYEVEITGLSGEFTASRTITWWLIILIIVGIGLIIWGVVWGRRRRRRAAQEG